MFLTKKSFDFFLVSLIAVVFAHSFAEAARAEDITQVIMASESAGTQTGVPVTFGQVFRAGDVPDGTALQARLSDGTNLSLQVDPKSVHGDGSLRHAVVTVQIPSLAASESKGVILSTGSGSSSGSAPTIQDALDAGVDAVVSLDVGGTTYTASAADMLQALPVRQWLSGPLVSEWIVGGPVRTSGNTAHPHLAAYFHVRYYAAGRARIDVIVENGWTFVSNPNSFTYDASITVPGSGTVYSKSGLTHYSQTRWHRVAWWNGESEVYPRLDTEYLQATGAVPNYADLTPSEAKLDSLRSSVEPMDHGDLRDVWSPGGAHAQLAPLPEWTALYLVSGDRRAYDAMIANSAALGAYSLHYRDESTGLIPTIDDYPAISITVNELLPPENGQSPYIEDRAHQPSTSYVPYLVTGDYFHLEELQYMANYNLIFANSSKRNGSAGEFLRDRDYETRGWAWGLRAIGEAGYATPDSHTLKNYFVEKVNNNLQYIRDEWSSNPAFDGYELGIIPSSGSGGPWGRFSYWQQAFFAWSIGHLFELGYNAGDVRDWKSIWTDGIMGPDFCYQMASNNRESVEDPDNPGHALTTFAALWERHSSGSQCNTQQLADWMSSNLGSHTYEVGEMAYSHLYDSYYANLQPALAIAVDAEVASQNDWNTFVSSASPGRPEYSDNPQWAIEPRAEASPSGTPVISLAASEETVASGENFLLSWTVFNANACSASGGWSGTRDFTGSETVGPINSTTSFTLSCTGDDGSAEKTVEVALGSDSSDDDSGDDSDGGGSGGGITPDGYIWGSLAVGEEVYIDRDYTYSTVPGTYAGMSYLQTRNDDKFVADDDFLVFYLTEPATVFVGYDDRIGSLPSWLDSWTDTDQDLVTTDTTLHLYSRDYAAGPVTLGGNENGLSMYVVVASATLSEISNEPLDDGSGNDSSDNGDPGTGSGSDGDGSEPDDGSSAGGDSVVGGDSTDENAVESPFGAGALDPFMLMVLLILFGRAVISARRDEALTF